MSEADLEAKVCDRATCCHGCERLVELGDVWVVADNLFGEGVSIQLCRACIAKAHADVEALSGRMESQLGVGDDGPRNMGGFHGDDVAGAFAVHAREGLETSPEYLAAFPPMVDPANTLKEKLEQRATGGRVPMPIRHAFHLTSFPQIVIAGDPRMVIEMTDPDSVARIRALVTEEINGRSRPAPQWTKTAPTEEGYYWARMSIADDPEIVLLRDGFGFALGLNGLEAEQYAAWFPVKLEAPK
jgi:hypothetical protein